MTDITNGWPGKPGVPRDPGLPGAHWLKGYTEDAWMYDGDGGWWGPGYSHNLDAETVAARYSYLGPCLTPNEATALQARVAELEGALEAAARVLDKAGEQFTSYANQHSAKGTADGDQKAATNKQWAQRCFSAYWRAQESLEGKEE